MKQEDTQGVVKWFDATKGFGFIAGQDGTDYFCHFSHIVMAGYRVLAENQHVAFNVAKGPKGLFATNIRAVESVTEKAAA
jgi:CspA family cold shock protein